MDHQDWKPVVLKKTQKQIAKDTKKSEKKTLKKYRPTFSRKLDSEDYVPEAKISHSLKMQIQQARIKKKLTQKQLATSCNLPISTIKNYENGKVVPNGQILNKLKKVLGVKLQK